MKKPICACIAAAICLSLASCAKEAEETLNYEQPVISLVGAVNARDEESFLSCCLPQEEREYIGGEDYDKSFLESTSVAVKNQTTIAKLKSEITSAEEVTDEEIEALENDYNDRHKSHVSFTKAQRLEVNFTLSGLEPQEIGTLEIYAVRYENVWYIYNEITELTEFLS